MYFIIVKKRYFMPYGTHKRDSFMYKMLTFEIALKQDTAYTRNQSTTLGVRKPEATSFWLHQWSTRGEMQLLNLLRTWSSAISAFQKKVDVLGTGEVIFIKLQRFFTKKKTWSKEKISLTWLCYFCKHYYIVQRNSVHFNWSGLDIY